MTQQDRELRWVTAIMAFVIVAVITQNIWVAKKIQEENLAVFNEAREVRQNNPAQAQQLVSGHLLELLSEVREAEKAQKWPTDNIGGRMQLKRWLLDARERLATQAERAAEERYAIPTGVVFVISPFL